MIGFAPKMQRPQTEEMKAKTASQSMSREYKPGDISKREKGKFDKDATKLANLVCFNK